LGNGKSRDDDDGSTRVATRSGSEFLKFGKSLSISRLQNFPGNPEYEQVRGGERGSGERVYLGPT